MSDAFKPDTLHRRRLRDVWRSAGWPCHDRVEVELLVAGLIERVRSAAGHETLRVTDAGVAVLADTLQRNRRARDAHEALVERVARTRSSSPAASSSTSTMSQHGQPAERHTSRRRRR